MLIAARLVEGREQKGVGTGRRAGRVERSSPAEAGFAPPGSQKTKGSGPEGRVAGSWKKFFIGKRRKWLQVGASRRKGRSARRRPMHARAHALPVAVGGEQVDEKNFHRIRCK